MLNLETLQTWMEKAITAEVKEPEVLEKLTANSKLSARERLNIYVRDFWGRVLDSLAEDFPELVDYWGRKKFDKWMEEYVNAYPSVSHTLRDLPQFLEKFLIENYKEKDLDLILDYVRFEWLHIQSSDTGEFPVVDFTKFKPDQISQVNLQFQPHLNFLELKYPVHKGLKTNLKPGQTILVIYRKDFQTFHEKIDELFFKFLKQLEKDGSLQKASESLSTQLNEKEIESLQKNLPEWIQKCVTLGWLQEASNA